MEFLKDNRNSIMIEMINNWIDTKLNEGWGILVILDSMDYATKNKRKEWNYIGDTDADL